MIALLQGTIAVDGRDHVILLCGGVGYKVYGPPTVTGAVGEHLILHTSMVVREDPMTLYGFVTPAERDLFETLLTVSGVGPKVALSILSTLSGDALRNAIVADRPEILSRVPGIGKKTAQKILFGTQRQAGSRAGFRADHAVQRHQQRRHRHAGRVGLQHRRGPNRRSSPAA
ncbi:MAG: Holliday junction branch migration protein RuvA [Chloroflexi bacterium]|nr:Holliday junction branch migration protein RuvA [Chloroflexota bacterium]